MCRSPGDVLLGLCSGSERLVIVAPYIKVDTLKIMLADVSQLASLTCVTRWKPHDLAVGASDAECRTIVKDFGGSFRLHPSLHAKYYRIDDVVLIGSANLTFSAMGWTPQPNLEILCQPGEDFDASAFESELFKNAREVSDEEFRRWQAFMKINTPDKYSDSGDQPRLGNWRPKTRDPRHIVLSYRGTEEQIASYDEQTAARTDIQKLQIPAELSNDEVRTWAFVCLLNSPFAHAVIQLLGEPDKTVSYRILSGAYGLRLTEARRDMETVQNWLAFFAPEFLSAYR